MIDILTDVNISQRGKVDYHCFMLYPSSKKLIDVEDWSRRPIDRDFFQRALEITMIAEQDWGEKMYDLNEQVTKNFKMWKLL